MENIEESTMEDAVEQQPEQAVKRDRPEVDESRKQLVNQWASRVKNAKDVWKPKFDKMRRHQEFAHGKQMVDDDGNCTEAHQTYIANLTLRRINSRVASLYAKNPRATAKRRPRMDYKVWDGKPETLAQAQQIASMAPQLAVADPIAAQQMAAQVAQAQALLADVQSGNQRKAMLDRIGKTLEIVFHYSLDEPIPKFKTQAKQLVRRALTCGVGYVQLSYQRIMEAVPEVDAKLKDVSDRLAQMERIAADLADGQIQTPSAEVEQLRLMVEQLQAEREVMVREGLIFDFPKPWQIIVDPECTQLKGFVGAGWVAREYLYSPERVQEIWNVDVSKTHQAYTQDGNKGDKRKRNTDNYATVWQIWDLRARIMYVVCDGHPDFLYSGQPDVDLEQFHQLFVLSFNDVEDDDDIYPPSDVELMMPMQLEYNRSREGLRQHRIAGRPAWAARKGAFGDEDKQILATHASHELIDVNLREGEKIADVLQPKPTIPIDEALYNTDYLFTDILRTGGDAEPNFGGTSGATATESTIAENNRASGLQSNVDDLDELFTEIARACGQILLKEMSPQTAMEIAGEGAMWPELDRTTIMRELQLEIKAGSSGRPNRALKIANIEKLAPFIIQTPKLNPTWWITQLVQEVDDTIDLSDAISEGMPSITALNGMAQPSTGNPDTDPNQQGGKGANNAPKPEGSQSGGQQLHVAGPRPQPPAAV